MRACTDLEEVLGLFYTYVIENGDDPKAMLREWNIIVDPAE